MRDRISKLNGIDLSKIVYPRIFFQYMVSDFVAAGFFRQNARSEGAAEGGCEGNSAALERSAGAKRRRVSFPQNGFAQSLKYPMPKPKTTS